MMTTKAKTKTEPTLQDLQEQLQTVENEIAATRTTPAQETAAILAGVELPEYDQSKIDRLQRKIHTLKTAVKIKKQAAAVEMQAAKKARRLELMAQHREYVRQAHQHLRDYCDIAMQDAALWLQADSEGICLDDVRFPLTLARARGFYPTDSLEEFERNFRSLLEEETPSS